VHGADDFLELGFGDVGTSGMDDVNDHLQRIVWGGNRGQRHENFIATKPPAITSMPTSRSQH
jgi:hypothetical protein